MQLQNDDIEILRALCQTEDAGLRRRACEILETYSWAEGEHRVIFEGCAALVRFGAPVTCGSLAAQVTRAGFPDVDLDSFFEPLPSATAELARRLDGITGNPR